MDATKLPSSIDAIKRTPLLNGGLTGVEGKEVFMITVDAPPGAEFPPHIHHGDELIYMLEGSMDGFMEETSATINAGEVVQIPREMVHGGKITGSTPAKLLTVYVLDKGKPFAELVKR